MITCIYKEVKKGTLTLSRLSKVLGVARERLLRVINRDRYLLAKFNYVLDLEFVIALLIRRETTKELGYKLLEYALQEIERND